MQARSRELPSAAFVFDYTNYRPTVSVLKPLVGQSGMLRLSLLTVHALDQVEDYLLFAALTDSGQPLDEEQARRLLGISARICQTCVPLPTSESLTSLTILRQEAILKTISQRNAAFFEAEANKLDSWADDLKAGLESEIKDLDRHIREARRAATAALTLEEKLDAQKRIKVIETQRNTKRRALFDAQDDIDHRRTQLISDIEGKLERKTTLLELFTIQWNII
jgi:adenine-specific DNA-methyltransferase